MELNKIYNEDCLETMSRMPDNFVDLCYADPPFNADFEYENWKDDEEYIKFCHGWFAEARRISKKIVITPGNKNIYFYPKPYGIFFAISKASLSNIAYLDPVEIILVYDPPFERLPTSLLRFGHTKFKTDHPCPDSEEMVANIIHYWSVKNDILYDPFSGSGSLAEQAERYNRQWIGSEINPEYCVIANKRIKAEQDQYKLVL